MKSNILGAMTFIQKDKKQHKQNNITGIKEFNFSSP